MSEQSASTSKLVSGMFCKHEIIKSPFYNIHSVLYGKWPSSNSQSLPPVTKTLHSGETLLFSGNSYQDPVDSVLRFYTLSQVNGCPDSDKIKQTALAVWQRCFKMVANPLIANLTQNSQLERYEAKIPKFLAHIVLCFILLEKRWNVSEQWYATYVLIFPTISLFTENTATVLEELIVLWMVSKIFICPVYTKDDTRLYGKTQRSSGRTRVLSKRRDACRDFAHIFSGTGKVIGSKYSCAAGE